MGRAKKPTHLKVVEGTRDRRGAAGAALEPVPENPLGDPPSYLTAREQEVWRRVGEELPPGMLKSVDEYTVTAFCRAVALADEAAELLRAPVVYAHPLGEGETRPPPPPPLLATTPNGHLVPNAYLSIINRQAVLIKALGADLGLSPGARTRISLKADDDEGDPTAKYFA